MAGRFVHELNLCTFVRYVLSLVLKLLCICVANLLGCCIMIRLWRGLSRWVEVARAKCPAILRCDIGVHKS